VLQAGGTAPARTDSLFQACSISKAVTAVATLRLVQAGALDLDTDVNHYLRTWKVPANDTWQPIVTIRQLLSHTAGINVPWFYGYHRDQDIPSLKQILTGEKPANTPGIQVNMLPGTRFRYSGGGYCVLQQLLCDVRQLTFPDLMRDVVLEPVGMAQSTFEQPFPAKYGNNTASGHRASGKPLAGGWHTMPEMAAAGLWTTATDLARFSIDLQLALAGQEAQLLSPEMVRILLSPQVQREPTGFMGLGVWLDGSGATARFGHPGDNEGFASRWTALREGGMGAVILTNSDNGGELIADVFHTIGQAYGWPEIKNLPAPPPHMSASMMDCVGIYQFRSGIACSITHVFDRLYIQMLDQPPVPLTAVSDAVYILQPLEGELIFLRDEKGIVRGFRLRQDGKEVEADKLPGL
jgi:CubicO group peptidase (beta-lactamase class C family)